MYTVFLFFDPVILKNIYLYPSNGKRVLFNIPQNQKILDLKNTATLQNFKFVINPNHAGGAEIS